MEYLLENVIAEHQVNLVAGSSGSGKTRWIFQLKHEMENSRRFLGYKTQYVRWGYLSGDRSGESIRETLSNMGMNPRTVPIYSCVDNKAIGKSIPALWAEVCEVLERVPDFLVIDGFTSFCPEGEINNYAKVAKWLGGLQGWCQDQQVTILGACHTTKSREGEEITDPRQRILGSTAWAAYTEGVVVIDKPHQGGEKDAHRDIYMCGRNSGMEIVKVQFNDQGWLEEREEQREKTDALGFLLEDTLRPGTEHKSANLEKLAMDLGKISRATFHRWLAKQKERGALTGGKGMVVVPWKEVREEEEIGVIG